MPSAIDSAVDYFEMANLFPKHTGLPFVVWISVKGDAQNDVRIKVSPGAKALPSEMSSVAIRPAVEVKKGHLGSSDLELLKRWVELNRETILKYRESEIDTQDAVNALRPIE